MYLDDGVGYVVFNTKWLAAFAIAVWIDLIAIDCRIVDLRIIAQHGTLSTDHPEGP